MGQLDSLLMVLLRWNQGVGCSSDSHMGLGFSSKFAIALCCTSFCGPFCYRNPCIFVLSLPHPLLWRQKLPSSSGFCEIEPVSPNVLALSAHAFCNSEKSHVRLYISTILPQNLSAFLPFSCTFPSLAVSISDSCLAWLSVKDSHLQKLHCPRAHYCSGDGGGSNNYRYLFTVRCPRYFFFSFLTLTQTWVYHFWIKLSF